jgi:hypothetical protein
MKDCGLCVANVVAGLITNMDTHLTRDIGAVIDHLRRHVRSEDRSMPFVWGDDLRLFMRQTAIVAVPFVRLWSRLPRRRIHVSPMSETWLRVHEVDHHKHTREI